MLLSAGKIQIPFLVSFKVFLKFFFPRFKIKRFRNDVTGKDWKRFKYVVKMGKIATFEEAVIVEKSLISVETEEEASVLQKTINKTFPKRSYNSEIQIS